MINKMYLVNNKIDLLMTEPVKGKTYSLFGSYNNSGVFYEMLKNFVEKNITMFGKPETLLEEIQKESGKKRKLKKYLSNYDELNFISYSLNYFEKNFAQFIGDIESHIKGLTLKEKCEKTLTLSKEQYYLFIQEIELTNLINKKEFINSEYKIAFLPHCLKDLSRKCLSIENEIDFYCKGCSKICYVNEVSKILRNNNVDPYIWMKADLKDLFKELKNKYKTIGVLGIACVPELVNGTRLCRKYNVPAIGIPLNANRCARWMGEFYPNSVNLDALKRIIN